MLGQSPLKIMNEKTRRQFLDDPVYGPKAPFFWPATKSDAINFAFYDRSTDCTSTKDFLENYEHDYSGAAHYIEETEYPKEKYVDELHADFQKLYHGIESWPYHTFFVSAVYRILFHDISPYQSKLYDVRRSSRSDLLDEKYLSKGLYDEAIKSEFFQSLEEIQQDKETDKVGGRISEDTWSNLIMILLDPDSDPYSDPLVCQELTRLLKQYNLVDSYPEHYNKKLLSKMKLDGNLPPK